MFNQKWKNTDESREKCGVGWLMISSKFLDINMGDWLKDTRMELLQHLQILAV